MYVGGAFETFTVIEASLVFPAQSVATIFIVWLPSTAFVVSHWYDVWPRMMPTGALSINRDTAYGKLLSVTVKFIDTVPDAGAPSCGETIETVGRVLSATTAIDVVNWLPALS